MAEKACMNERMVLIITKVPGQRVDTEAVGIEGEQAPVEHIIIEKLGDDLMQQFKTHCIGEIYAELKTRPRQ